MTDTSKSPAKAGQDATKPQPGSRAAATKEAAAEKAKAKKAEKKPLSFKWVLWLLLLTVILLLGFGGWSGVKQLSFLKSQNETAISELNESTSNQIASISEQTKAQETQVADIKAQQEKMATALEQLVAHVRNMPQLSDVRGNQWRLAEAEYLTRLAHRKLVHEQDIVTSMTLLHSADALLLGMGDPSTDSLRQAFQTSILELESLELADVDDIVVQLDAMIGFASQLPLPRLTQSEANPEEAEAADAVEQSAWKQALEDNWQAIKGLVTVRQLDQPVQPLLPPEQRVYLDQNLRLLLEQAQLAALRRDSTLFQSRLRQAKEWVETYFFVEDAKVKSIIAKFDELSAAPISAEVPDLRPLVSAVGEFKHQYLFSAVQPETKPVETVEASSADVPVVEDAQVTPAEDLAPQE